MRKILGQFNLLRLHTTAWLSRQQCPISHGFISCSSNSIFYILLFSCLAVPAAAQETFTRHLTRNNAGEGRVVLHQDAEIEALVNGITPSSTASASKANTAANKTASKVVAQSDTVTADTTLNASVRRVRVNGYRIQVYAGGNNRQSKSEAYRMAALVRSSFDDVPVYTHFISPRWICRVGDFRTYEEATDMLRRMRETQKFREASIVKSKIILLY